MTYNTKNNNYQPAHLFEKHIQAIMNELAIPAYSSHEDYIKYHPQALDISSNVLYKWNKKKTRYIPISDLASICDFVDVSWDEGNFNTLIEVKCHFKTLDYSSIGNVIFRLKDKVRDCIFPNFDELIRSSMPYMLIIGYYSKGNKMHEQSTIDGVKALIDDYVIIMGVGNKFRIDSPKNLKEYLEDNKIRKYGGKLTPMILAELEKGSIYYKNFEDIVKTLPDELLRDNKYDQLLDLLEALEQKHDVKVENNYRQLAEPLKNNYRDYAFYNPKPQSKATVMPEPKAPVTKYYKSVDGIAYKIQALLDDGFNKDQVIDKLNSEGYRGKQGKLLTRTDINQVLPPTALINKDLTMHIDELKARLVALYQSDMGLAKRLANRKNKKSLSKQEAQVLNLWMRQYYNQAFSVTCLRYTWAYHKDRGVFAHTKKQALDIALNKVKPEPKAKPKPEPKAKSKPEPKAKPKPEPKTTAPTFTAAPAQLDLFSYSNDQKILDAIEELRQDIASIKEMLNTQQLKESDQLRKAAELITYSANMLEEKERGLS